MSTYDVAAMITGAFLAVVVSFLLFRTHNPPAAPAQPAVVYAQPAVPETARECLALAAFTEARSEGIAGMAAVAEVVINRWKGDRWPLTVCSVVHQDSQFLGTEGWTARKAEHRNQEAWEQALAVADLALEGAAMSPAACRGAIYFNQSRKAKGYKHLCRIGVHHFYIEGN